MKFLSLFVLLSAALTPADVPGWDKAVWGMTPVEAQAAIGDRAELVTSPVKRGLWLRKIRIDNVPIGSVRGVAWLEFYYGNDQLESVSIEIYRRFDPEAAGNQLRETLGEAYGTPVSESEGLAVWRSGKGSVWLIAPLHQAPLLVRFSKR